MYRVKRYYQRMHCIVHCESFICGCSQDIVTEDTSFDLVSFMPLLRERMFTNNQFACQFIISWISVLADVPHIDLIKFLPEILDGLFKILGEPTIEIKKM